VRVAVLPAPVAPAGPAVVAPPPPSPSPLAAEQSLLGQALKALREGHDAPAALALLGQHAERFTAPALAAEAAALRVEALLTLGRRSEALSILDEAPIGSLPRPAERLVVRGELRAGEERWREAKQDFDDALAREQGKAPSWPAASPRSRDIQERGLWGRAAARSRLGDATGARADLDQYLRYFPGGRFAGAAASLVKDRP
jgi:tetratricopeptide (TPR) repeat protein